MSAIPDPQGQHSTAGAIDVEAVSYRYPDGRAVLHEVDLHVEAGERVALLGPNGAGKTTLVLHLNGILGAVAGGQGSGRIAIGGLELTRSSVAEVRRRVGLVFQDPDDQLFMPTVWDDVAFGPSNLGLRPAEVEARVQSALDAVRMTPFADRAPSHLSYGQRRRVAVAGVLAMHPQVIVADEPSSNLDPAARRELAEILESLPTTLLMVTHDLPYALQLCTRAVLLDEGRIVADGATREVLGDAELMRAHRLELPYGFDPLSVPGPEQRPDR